MYVHLGYGWKKDYNPCVILYQHILLLVRRVVLIWLFFHLFKKEQLWKNRMNNLLEENLINEDRRKFPVSKVIKVKSRVFSWL